tara:strand:+ start:659 stop:1306 length:648 start_codon:yes stop_codon:yes gene_type:complete
MKKIFAIISTVLFLSTISAKADFQFGVGLMLGELNADGKETEGTAAEINNTKTTEEMFYGADLFVEYVTEGEWTLGVSYVPMDFEIGNKSRGDTTAGADVAAEADVGTRTAKANLSNMMGIYVNAPLGFGGLYGLVGASHTSVETKETLPNSKYGNKDIMGYSVGLGKRSGKFKMEISYTDFEDIALNSSVTDASGTNKVTADADALTLRMSLGF